MLMYQCNGIRRVLDAAMSMNRCCCTPKTDEEVSRGHRTTWALKIDAKNLGPKHDLR